MIKLDKTKIYDLSELTSEELDQLLKHMQENYGWGSNNIHTDLFYKVGEGWLYNKVDKVSNMTNAKELFYTLENIQVSCRGLNDKQIENVFTIFSKNYEVLKTSRVDWSDEVIRISKSEPYTADFFEVDESKTTITYEKFIELFGDKEKSEEFNLEGYSVEVDNESQASMLQEIAFKQGFGWYGINRKISHSNRKFFQFEGTIIYCEDKHPEDLKQIHFNDIYSPQYDVTMIAEKPKYELCDNLKPLINAVEILNDLKTYKEKSEEFKNLVEVLNEELEESRSEACEYEKPFEANSVGGSISLKIKPEAVVKFLADKDVFLSPEDYKKLFE